MNEKLSDLTYSVPLTNEEKQKLLQKFNDLYNKEKVRLMKSPILPQFLQRHILDPLMKYAQMSDEELLQGLGPSYGSYRQKPTQDQRYKRTNLSSLLVEAQILGTILPDYTQGSIFESKQEATNLILALASFLHLNNKSQANAKSCLETIFETQDVNMTVAGLSQVILEKTNVRTLSYFLNKFTEVIP